MAIDTHALQAPAKAPVRDRAAVVLRPLGRPSWRYLALVLTAAAGLLPAPPNTTALLHGGRYTEAEEIERRTQARMERRQVLTRISQGLHVVGVLASVALLVRPASFWNPVSWALLALTQFLGWLARRFPHLNVVRRQYITTAVRKTDERLRSLETAAVQQAKEPIQQLIAQGLTTVNVAERLVRVYRQAQEQHSPMARGSA
jgi:uncharacterized protein YoaH (UPF0181 family)